MKKVRNLVFKTYEQFRVWYMYITTKFNIYLQFIKQVNNQYYITIKY